MKHLQVLGLFLVATSIFANVHAQSVEEVISKHIEAIGGKENWKKVNTMKSEASLNVQGMDIPLTIYQVNNKAMKQEYSVMNMTAFTIMRTDSGWNYMPFNGMTAPEPVTAEELKVGQDGLDIQGELLDYAEKGHKVELMGKEDVDGTEAYKVKLTRKSGTEVINFIDPSNYLVIRTIQKLKVNGQEIENKTNYSNYQKLEEGILMPFTLESTTIPAPINFKKFEVNVDIPESTFRPVQ